MQDVVVLAEGREGQATDLTREMLGGARTLAQELGGQVIALVLGGGIDPTSLTGADRALVVEDPALAGFSPEPYARALAGVLQDLSPRLTLIGATSQGMDLAADVGERIHVPHLAYCKELRLEGGEVVGVAQVYGGKLFAEASTPGALVAGVLAGSMKPVEGPLPTVETVGAPVSLEGTATRFVQEIPPEAGDVDITKQDLLVSVGRGIGDQENISLAEELAEALGAVVTSSRPLVDSGWFPKSRQVGKSGQTVKPKAYLALGISGAPEHLEGMRESTLIIAVNTDPSAPIFEVAHFGATVDILDLIPALTEKVQGERVS